MMSTQVLDWTLLCKPGGRTTSAADEADGHASMAAKSVCGAARGRAEKGSWCCVGRYLPTYLTLSHAQFCFSDAVDG